MSRKLLLRIVCILFLGLPLAGRAQDSAPQVLVLTLDAPITPAAASYLERGLQIARQAQAEALVLQLDTPGGSVDSMNRMVQAIRNSEVPVLVYVTPRGAMAASAGTVITLAGHLSAMAPETVIGAASPVGSQGEDIGETMERKVKEVLKATARSLAERRGPQAVALAEATIEEARAVSAQEALQVNLVDFIAPDLPHLLSQAEGQEVLVLDKARRLHTASATLTFIEMSIIESLLVLLTNPNIVFLLLTLGVQAILIEISHPGGWFAGFLGVVSLALATYGMGVLPVNWFGLVFIITAFVLFLLDVKAPTHGALTAAGIGSFITGALVLFNSAGVPQFQRVSVPLVVTVGLAFGIAFAFLVRLGIKAMRQKPRMGKEILVGQSGLVKIALTPKGQVQVAGELWSAEPAPGEAAPIPEGTRIRVEAIHGLRLLVRREQPSRPEVSPPASRPAPPPR